MASLVSRLYNAVLRDDGQRYQLLCANCNWIKREEKGEACKHTIFHDMSLREIAKERDGIFVNEAISFLECACEDSLKADADACIMNAIADKQMAAAKLRRERLRMAARRKVPFTSRVRMRQRYLPQP